ncbi:ATP-binding cassette domain-containing protein [Bellilinea caldifistulae]|uniref:ATP-binding cassette domain-containing protein n=1 Tax=Bellilinea caldifistulae TaxID=360411 RepID=UPI000781C56B|nr:ATP-binding cassette domain-containing protein [Bellilinea caldifistulae]
MNEAVLRFEQVVYRDPDAAERALQGLSLDVPRGRVTAILGPNGAGKTTLLRLAYGRFQPQAGRIWLEGRLLSSYTRQELGRKVALCRNAKPIHFLIRFWNMYCWAERRTSRRCKCRRLRMWKLPCMLWKPPACCQ